MKVALVTDLHIGARKGNKIFHEYFAKFYSNTLIPTLKDRGITELICLGDTFDVRKGIDFWSLRWSRDVLFTPLKELGIRSHLIVGNHDIFYRNSTEINSVGLLLKDYDNLCVYSNPTTITLDNKPFLFVPWICDSNYQQTLDEIKQTSAEVVFGHLELKGFEAHPGFVCDKGQDVSMFSKFRHVYSGHFHCRSSNKNVTYIGNCFQLYWNDEGDTRGFYIYDTETEEMEFIPNPYSLFRKFYYNEGKVRKFDPTLFTGHYVKIVVENKKSQKKFNDFLAKVYDTGIVDLKVIESFDIDVQVYDTLEVQDTLTLLSEYVNEVETDLNKDNIMNILKSLYHEAQEVL